MMVRLNKQGYLYLVSGTIILIGLIETFIGWCQILGFKPSLHVLYPATGTFYNPGPYACFIAVIIPLALYNVLNKRNPLFHWLSLTYLILSVSILPVLMSRTAWISTAVGMILTAIGTGYIKKPGKKVILVSVAIGLLLLLLIAMIKPASAMGRIFLWLMGSAAICEDPLTGVGWSHVAGALGRCQESYFSSHQDSMFSMVAGTPEYAFNEYLQIGIAFGIPVMFGVIILLVYSIYAAWKGGQYGISSAIVSLGIVCLASYPFQFSEFIILGTLLLIAAIVSSDGRRLIRYGLGLCIMVIGVVSIVSTQKRIIRHKEWESERFGYIYFFTNKDILYLDSILAKQKDNPKFLFDYGKALRDLRYFEKSNDILKRGEVVSSDPMFLNLMGRNYQDLGDIDQAEQYYRRSINRLPGRLYPYYLLGKLYADSSYGNRKKFDEVYLQAMKMEAKVMSPAIKEMREELRKLKSKR